MSRVQFFAFIGAALALSACTEGKINYVQIDPSYDPTLFARLPYTGPLYAEVSGNPFSIPQDQLTAIVNGSIQPSNAAPGNGQGPRVHIAFGPTATDRHDACFAGGQVGRVNGTISMVAAFCRGTDYATTYLVASIDGVTGPDDPRFRAFLRQTTVQLFPPRTGETTQNMHDTLCIFPSC